MEELTLDQLAQKHTAVYLDNSILNRDSNMSAQRQTPYFRRGISIPSVAEKLGAAESFRDVKQSVLNRQAGHAQRMSVAVETYGSLRSAPLIVKEYEKLVNHFEEVLMFLIKRSGRKSGLKEEKLWEIISSHQQIYDWLLLRSPADAGADNLTRYLQAERLHLSPDNRFVKRNPAASTSVGDSSLVSYALREASPAVAIVTVDFDIVNLVRNYGLRSYRKELPAAFNGKGQETVTVYFPADSGWNPGLGLQFMCNTEGEQAVYGTRSRYL